MNDGCAWVRFVRIVLAALVLSGGAAAAQEAEADTAEADDERVVEEVIVTGTRLQGGDPTARVDVVTADDIARQGLTTVEDVIRSLPQNFSTINSSNSLHFGSDLLDANLGALGLGAATANLRGFGSKNTLVLLNGKRLAGIASSAQSLAANLNDIPAGAIERVEISLDGGSAVYGSDAVAGVINIITRRDFKGLSFGGKVEDSSTGGDAQSGNLYGGFGWGSGNASVIFTMHQARSGQIRRDRLYHERLQFPLRRRPEIQLRRYGVCEIRHRGALAMGACLAHPAAGQRWP